MSCLCSRHCVLLLLLLAYAEVVLRRIYRCFDEYHCGTSDNLHLLRLLLPWANECQWSSVWRPRRRTGPEANFTLNVAEPFLRALSALPPIPRKVHVTWRNAPTPPGFGLYSHMCIRSLFSLNPTWHVRAYNDSEIDAYLREALPQFGATAYAEVRGRHIVEKIDLWRLVVLYAEGGIYMDADRWATVPLDEAIPPTARLLLPTEFDQSAAQDFMASAPRSPLFRHAIELNLARRRDARSHRAQRLPALLAVTARSALSADAALIFALGPVLWQHAISHVVLGLAATDVWVAGDAVRAAVARVGARHPQWRHLIAAPREAPPCETTTTRVLARSAFACVVLSHHVHRSKLRAYAHLKTAHWSQLGRGVAGRPRAPGRHGRHGALALPTPGPSTTRAAPTVFARQIVIKGERHTATNFAKAILQHSLGVCNPEPEAADASCPYCGQCAHCDPHAAEPSPTSYCCWKHGYASVRCEGWSRSQAYPAHVFVTRSIYPWLLAMYREPYEYRGPPTRGPFRQNFSAFIRRRFAYAPLAYPRRPEAHANPIQLWNAKVRSYVRFAAHPNVTSVRLTHDDLFSLDALRRKLRPLLAARGYKLRTPSGRVEYPPFATTQRKFYEDFTLAGFERARRDARREAWRSHLTPADVDFINAQVDAELMRAFGLPLLP